MPYIVEHRELEFTNVDVDEETDIDRLRCWQETLEGDIELLNLHKEQAKTHDNEDWLRRVVAKRKMYIFLMQKVKARLIILGNSFPDDFMEVAKRYLDADTFADLEAKTMAGRKIRFRG